MVLLLFTLASISSLITGSQQAITSFMANYGYWSVLTLMALESSSLPVPSEVVMPLAGLLVAQGTMNFAYAFIAALAGSVIGMAVDYYIAYFIEKDIVYKYLKKFHIKEHWLDDFTAWFDRNGAPAVFLTRMLPVVRTVISFPAGFAKMDQRKFFTYSIAGSAIWNAVLMAFGFYALNASSAATIMAAVAAFAIVLYVIFTFAMRRIRKR